MDKECQEAYDSGFLFGVFVGIFCCTMIFFFIALMVWRMG